MFIQIAPKARVYVTESDAKFIKEHMHGSFRSNDLTPEDADRAKRLADKAVFVRKNLTDDMQYALNRKIRIIDEHKQFSKTHIPTDRMEKR